MKDWRPYARHILDTVTKIRRIQERGSIVADDILYDAVLRNLQTLSEATQSLPEELKAQHADIPWKEISGFRNILIHNYLGNIDPQPVVTVIEKHLDPLQESVESMLK
jgi:uncharacterized protein with HEPN domain